MLAIAYAQDIGAKTKPPVEDFILLTHTKSQLRSTSLADHLGETVKKALDQGRKPRMPAHGSLRHATLQTLSSVVRNAVVIAYYAEDRMLERLDGMTGLAGIVAVPDLPGNADGWIERWNPKVHGMAAKADTPIITDSVVVNALTSLGKLANLAHDVLHPRDKEYANETLRILFAKGHLLEPAKVKSWAIKNGWKPGTADELAKLAQRIGSLKNKPTLSSFHDAKGRYERWRG